MRIDLGSTFPAPTITDVDVERDRRIANGFDFRDKRIPSRAADRENIAGATQAAQDARLLGAQPNDYGWQKLLTPDGAETFAWITADNTMLPLDVDAMIEMGYAAMIHKQRLIFIAKSLKDRIAAGEQIPTVRDDSLWS